jgi:hypothetical protein
VLLAWCAALWGELIVVAIVARGALRGILGDRAGTLGGASNRRRGARAGCVRGGGACAPRPGRGDELAASAARARRLLALLGAAFGGLVAYGVSFGRHMADSRVRVPFVLAVAAAAPWARRTWRPAPRGQPEAAVRRRGLRRGPRGGGVVRGRVRASALYPAFHLALGALTLGAIALTVAPSSPRHH